MVTAPAAASDVRPTGVLRWSVGAFLEGGDGGRIPAGRTPDGRAGARGQMPRMRMSHQSGVTAASAEGWGSAGRSSVPEAWLVEQATVDGFA